MSSYGWEYEKSWAWPGWCIRIQNDTTSNIDVSVICLLFISESTMVSCLKKLCTSFLPKGIYKSNPSSQTLGKFSPANFCQAASWRDFCQPRPLLSKSPHPQSQIAADIFWHPLSILRRVFSQDVLSLSDTARAIDTNIEIQNKHQYMDLSYITIYAIYEYTTCIEILMLHEFPCHPAAGEGWPMPSRSAQIALAALHVKKLPKQQESPLCPDEKLQLQKNKLILIQPHYTHIWIKTCGLVE